MAGIEVAKGEGMAEAAPGSKSAVNALVVSDRGALTPEYLNELERKAALYDSVQNAAKNLPDGWEVALWIENGYGGWTVTSPDDEEINVDADGRSLAEQLDSIVEIACGEGGVKERKRCVACKEVSALHCANPESCGGPWSDNA